MSTACTHLGGARNQVLYIFLRVLRPRYLPSAPPVMPPVKITRTAPIYCTMPHAACNVGAAMERRPAVFPFTMPTSGSLVRRCGKKKPVSTDIITSNLAVPPGNPTLPWLASINWLPHLLYPWLILESQLLVGILVYRRYFHPLSAYPGPWLATLTSAYGAYHSATGDSHLDIKHCHAKYGPIVRYGPNRLIFSSIRSMHEIYGYGNPLKKSSSYLPMVPWKDGWTVISCIDSALHKRMRQTLQAGLSSNSLRAFEEASVRNIDTLVSIITTDADIRNQGWSSPKDMTAHAKWLAIDSMGSLRFGRNIGLLTEPSLRYIVGIFDLYTWRTGFFEQWPRQWFTGIEEILNMARHFSPVSRKFCTWRQEYTNATISFNGRPKMSVFSGLARSKVDGKDQYQYSRSQMEAEGSFILLVAGDSNATAISAALFYLSRYQNVYDKLCKEVRTIFSTLDEVRSGNLLNKCTYLSAVTEEVLRMHPPSPGVPWRVAGPDTTIDGTVIPEGTDVGVCLYSKHHDGAVFRDPSRFWPERWLPDTLPDEELRLAKLAHRPFSMGPRNCAGRAVAMNEILLTLGRLLYQCDFRIPAGKVGQIGEGKTGNAWGRTEKNVFQFHLTVTIGQIATILADNTYLPLKLFVTNYCRIDKANLEFDFLTYVQEMLDPVGLSGKKFTESTGVQHSKSNQPTFPALSHLDGGPKFAATTRVDPALWLELSGSQIATRVGRALDPTFLRRRSGSQIQALRLYTPLGHAFRHAAADSVLPTGGGLSGTEPIFVPAGCEVIIHIHAIHRNKDIWGDDADAFRPERWLDEQTGQLRQEWHYLPFLGGARTCPARAMVTAQVAYVIARFAQQYTECRSTDAENRFVEEHRITLKIWNGIHVKLVD
nr:cytochrome p450 monooxygenase apf7 [Quercus suber]